ncbi:MAG: hypothetical protein Q9227_005007 [Pyrenula ochraceoflavens]
MNKKRKLGKKGSLPKQKSTLTQMDYLRDPYIFDSKDLENDLIYINNDEKKQDNSERPMIGSVTTDYPTPDTTVSPQVDLKGNGLRSVSKPIASVRKKKRKRKPDPWEVSSSQPEQVSLPPDIERPQRQSSRTARPAKLAATEKMKSMTAQLEAAAQKSTENDGLTALPKELPPQTPQKNLPKRSFPPDTVVPSSQSPESLPPSTHHSRKTVTWTKQLQSSPLKERSVNLPTSGSTTPLASKLDRESSPNRAECASNLSEHTKSLIVRLPVSYPAHWSRLQDGKSSRAASIGEQLQLDNEMVQRSSTKPSLHTIPKETIVPQQRVRSIPCSQSELPETELSMKLHASEETGNFSPLRRQRSKLLVDGWPEMEQMLGRPSAKKVMLQRAPAPNARIVSRETESSQLKNNNFDRNEAEFSIGTDTQAMFDKLNSSSSDEHQAEEVILGHKETGPDSAPEDGSDNSAIEEPFDLGSPVITHTPLSSRQTHSTEALIQTPSRKSTRALTSARRLRSQHGLPDSLPRSGPLPFPHQSQVSTQSPTQAAPSFYRPTAMVGLSSDSISAPAAISVKDEPSSTPIRMRDLPAFEEEDDEPEGGGTWDLDPTPRRLFSRTETLKQSPGTESVKRENSSPPYVDLRLSSSPSPRRDRPQYNQSPNPDTVQPSSTPDLDAGCWNEDYRHESQRRSEEADEIELPPHEPLAASEEAAEDKELGGDEKETSSEDEKVPSSSPILKTGVFKVRESLLESLPGPPPIPMREWMRRRQRGLVEAENEDEGEDEEELVEI